MTPVEDSATDTPAPRRSTAKAAAAPNAPRRRSASADAPPATKLVVPRAPTRQGRPEVTYPRAHSAGRAGEAAQVVTLPVLTKDQPIGQATQKQTASVPKCKRSGTP